MSDLQIQESPVPGQQQWTEPFPLVLQPLEKPQDFSAVEEWLAREHEMLLDQLTRHGAILLRDLAVDDALMFDRLVQAFGLQNFAYKQSLSNAVRNNITERVFTANEAPAEVAIYLHHEMAQTPYYPSRLFFYCEQAAESGGETPLCRSDILCTELANHIPEFLEQCQQLGIRYTNVMPADDDAGSGQGRSWRSTLRVDDRVAAEAKLAGLGYSWQWLAEDNLRVTTAALPAVRTLADGRQVFFNQVIAACRGWQDSRNEANKSICYGDGSGLADEHLATLIELSEKLTFDLAWKTGDVALVDNFLVMHGRNSFQGKRRVLASLIA